MDPSPDKKSISRIFKSSTSLLRSTASSALKTTRISLPGVSEIENVVKGLLNDMKTSGNNDDQYALLAKRLEYLLIMIQSFDGPQHPDLSDIVKELRELKENFETENKRHSRLGILGAERKEHILNSLRCETDLIVERTQLRMLSQMRAKPHWTDRVDIISEHEITNQELLLQTSRYRSAVGCSDHKTSFNNTTIVTSRCGQLGKLSVVYNTYSSPDMATASKTVEDELKLFSRLLHPNIANVIGITQGYYGPNGIVIQTGRIPLQTFLSRVSSGSALARCMKGIEAACKALQSPICKLSFYARFAVELDGHINALPLTLSDWRKDGTLPTNHLWDTGLCRNIPLHHFNPIALVMSEICFSSTTDSDKDQLAPFLDSVADLDSMRLTELELMRLAAEHGIPPISFRRSWSMPGAIPPFTVESGDIGQVVESTDKNCHWNVLDEGSPPIRNECDYMYLCGSHNPLHTGFPATNDQWISIPMCHCRDSAIYWASSEPVSLPYFKKQARRVAWWYSAKLDEMTYCYHVNCCMILEPLQKYESNSLATLYFHRNPSSRLSAREFWGFLSTSPDPYADVNEVEKLRWELDYGVEFHTCSMADEWGRRYQKKLRSGLASIPGGYPDSYIEDISDGEDS